MSAQTQLSSPSAFLARTLNKRRGLGVVSFSNQPPLTAAGGLANSTSESSISAKDKLQLLEQALDEIESRKNTPANQRIDPPEPTEPHPDGSQTPPPAAPSFSGKESEPPALSAVEQGASIQVVEAEKSPELSTEVEKYLQEVHKDQDLAPKEIAIADEIANLPSNNQFVSEPVIVLPITPEIQKKGRRKNPKFSVRWLVEWSQKIIKMFSGKVVYLEPSSKQ
jgi:hypothetical protein